MKNIVAFVMLTVFFLWPFHSFGDEVRVIARSESLKVTFQTTGSNKCYDKITMPQFLNIEVLTKNEDVLYTDKFNQTAQKLGQLMKAECPNLLGIYLSGKGVGGSQVFYSAKSGRVGNWYPKVLTSRDEFYAKKRAEKQRAERIQTEKREIKSGNYFYGLHHAEYFKSVYYGDFDWLSNKPAINFKNLYVGYFLMFDGLYKECLGPDARGFRRTVTSTSGFSTQKVQEIEIWMKPRFAPKFKTYMQAGARGHTAFAELAGIPTFGSDASTFLERQKCDSAVLSKFEENLFRYAYGRPPITR